MTDQDTEVVKWYTRARRFPQLIGRTADGTRIWGGPYTITQAIGAAAVLIVGLNTMPLWATSSLISNGIILTVATGATVYLLGKVPIGTRNPLSVCAGVLQALFAPRTGKYAGRPVRVPKPKKLKHHVVFGRPVPRNTTDESAAPTSVEQAAEPEPAPNKPPLEATPAATSGDTSRPALTGVQALLAAQPSTRVNHARSEEDR